MKVKIIRCSENRFWYYNPLFLGKIYDVDIETKDGYSVYDGNTIKFIHRRHCEVVDDNMDFLKHRWEEDKLKDIINEAKSDSNMKQIKMSIDTAREMYKDSTISTKSWLLENFTKEELEPKKGFIWEDSFKGSGQFINPLSGKIEGLTLMHGSPCEKDKCLYKTTAQAESALAFAQLSHIVARYNEGKKSGTSAWTVACSNLRDGCLFVDTVEFGSNLPHLVFLTKEDATTSIDVNRSLWEAYWMIEKH